MRRDKIFVGGNSAGGGMTAALTLYARDRGEVNIAFQMPLYPMLDDRPTETSKNNDAPVWNTKSNIAAWELYLGGDYGTDRVSKYAAPARETDFSGLPPDAHVHWQHRPVSCGDKELCRGAARGGCSR